MKSSLMIAAAALTFGAAGGYFIGSSASTAKSEERAIGNAGQSRYVTTSREDQRGGQKGNRIADVMAKPGQVDRMQGMIDYYDRLSPEDFAAEADKLESLAGAERFVASFLLFSRWGEEDPLAAIEYSNSLGFGGMMARPVILQGWAGKDPMAASKYYDENSAKLGGGFGGGRGGRGGMGFGGTGAAIASEWARQDPEAALTWAKTLKGGEGEAAMGSIFQSVSSTDPAKAASMIAQLEGDQKASAISELASTWASKDWEASQTWINSLPAVERAEAQASALQSLARTDAAFAAKEVLRLPDGEMKQTVMVDVAESLGRKNPADAVQWLTANGNAEVQAEGIGEVMSTWARTDRVGASAWLQQQPAGPVKDSATSSYVMSSRDVPASDRLQMAQSIGDEETRERTTSRVAFEWMRQDKEAATQWLQSTDSLPDDSKERIMNFSDRGGRGRFGR